MRLGRRGAPAEDSAARLAEASDRGEVVLVTESTLRQLLGGAEQGQQALSGGAAGGGAGLLAEGRSDGPGAAVARRAGVTEATPPATVSEETLPAVLAEHGVPLKDALAASAAPPQGPQLELLHAAADGDAPALEALLPQLSASDIATAMPPSGGTALHLASASGDVRAVRVLLAAGSAVNARARNGSTPLHWAAGG